jgi:hypothetical protein
MLFEVPLFQYHVFANDQTMRGHFFQRRQDAVHVHIRIHEDDDHRDFSSRVYEMTGFEAVPSQKSGCGMDCGRSMNVLPAQG